MASSLGEKRLRQVRQDELEDLKARLELHLPYSLVVYGSVSLALRYGLDTLWSTSILVPEDQRSSSFVAVTVVNSDNSQCLLLFWRIEEHNTEDVANYLASLSILDWTRPVHIPVFPNILLPSISLVKKMGDQQVRSEILYQGYIFTIETPSLLKTKSPSGYHVTRLQEEDTPVVWNNMEFKVFELEDDIRQSITHFPTVAVCEDGSMQGSRKTLVSWIRLCRFGWMRNTFTLPEHRRKGLASLATMTLAHQLLHEGLPTFVLIDINNTASIMFHKNLGFKEQNTVSAVVVRPVSPENSIHLG